MAPTEKQRILLTLTGGGHFFQAARLARQLSGRAELVLVTTAAWQAAPTAEQLGVSLHSVPPFQNYADRNPFGSLRRLMTSIAAARRVISKVKPDAIVAVGTDVSLPLFLCAKWRGIRCIFVESITRVEKLSVTARLLSRLGLTHRIYVQWPELAAPQRGIFYEGTVL